MTSPDRRGMELLERGEPLDTVHRLPLRVGEGFGNLVLIGGAAGIGETTLVRAFGGALPALSLTRDC